MRTSIFNRFLGTAHATAPVTDATPKAPVDDARRPEWWRVTLGTITAAGEHGGRAWDAHLAARRFADAAVAAGWAREDITAFGMPLSFARSGGRSEMRKPPPGLLRRARGGAGRRLRRHRPATSGRPRVADRACRRIGRLARPGPSLILRWPGEAGSSKIGREIVAQILTLAENRPKPCADRHGRCS
jgi:hypothetical protein